MLERYLVDQCSPTLAGIKTGSLFSIHGEDPERVLHEVQRINRIFYGKGRRRMDEKLGRARQECRREARLRRCDLQ